MLIFVKCGYSLYAYLWILLLYISVVECGYSLYAYLWILLLYISGENVGSAYMPIC
ncbi:unnamed protein product [Camellia sinensis]